MLTSESISQGAKARVSAEALPTPVGAKTGRGCTVPVMAEGGVGRGFAEVSARAEALPRLKRCRSKQRRNRP